jgi:hypothetical protein
LIQTGGAKGTSCRAKKWGQIFIFDKLNLMGHQRYMTRPLRIEPADGYYHVMNRGNNRQDIFLSGWLIGVWFIDMVYF